LRREKNAPAVRPVAQDSAVIFAICSEESAGCDPEISGETQDFVGTNLDRFVGTADAAYLAFEEKTALRTQAKGEGQVIVLRAQGRFISRTLSPFGLPFVARFL
jgi:hypothetical protein